MKFPFLEPREAYFELKEEIDSAISRVLLSGTYILGHELEAFEEEWASYCEARFAVGVGSGLDALILALRALDIGEGDEVVVPSTTFVATWLAVRAVGAKLVPVEPDPVTCNIDCNRIEAAITTATKVLLPVHLYGQPVDLDPILALAKKYNLFVIEDAAQAHGARYKDRRIGAHGDIVCWSFYPGKNLGAIGDAGAITTNLPDAARRLLLLRNYGSSQKYAHDLAGWNSRMDPIQAAVLRVKLRVLDEWNSRRANLARIYSAMIVRSDLFVPHSIPFVTSSWHLYVLRSRRRDELQMYLNSLGISTLIHYPIAPHQQRVFNSLGFTDDEFPLASSIANEVLSIPIGPHLNSAGAITIAEAINSFPSCPIIDSRP